MKTKSWFQFLVFLKASAIKQQILKCYLQILNIEARFNSCDRLLTESIVVASFCA